MVLLVFSFRSEFRFLGLSYNCLFFIFLLSFLSFNSRSILTYLLTYAMEQSPS